MLKSKNQEKMLKKPQKHRIRRICTRCGKKFTPTGRTEKLCIKCWYESKGSRKYWKNKKSESSP